MKWIIAAPLLAFSAFASAYNLTITMPDHEPVVLSMEQLKSKLPVSNFTTVLPWLEKGQTAEFSGFKMTDLLNYLKATQVKSATFIALNDYKASAPISDIEQYSPIIAYSMNHEAMKVRDKGPFWFLYDLSKYPQINTPDYHTQMVWQIKEISLSY